MILLSGQQPLNQNGESYQDPDQHSGPAIIFDKANNAGHVGSLLFRCKFLMNNNFNYNMPGKKEKAGRLPRFPG